MFQPLADRGMVVEEDFNQRRWLDVSKILVGETSHRTFEYSHHLRRLQRVLIGLILDSPT